MSSAKPGSSRTARRKDLFVWVDCEMTGLDPARDVLLEIATIVTDRDLKIVAHGPELAIHQSPRKLRSMDAWNRKTHKASGLLERVQASRVSVAEAERQTLRFLRKFCYAKTAPLCGNSVWQDKQFLARYMTDLHDFMHYRIVDVSSLKLLVKHWYPNLEPPAKASTHRALADIEESIGELRYYQSILTGQRSPESNERRAER
jgi:oligoribonuclease